MKPQFATLTSNLSWFINGHRRSAQNFTLIELLVVISIIAVLASMLLPTLNGARKRAHAIQCTSNLRQVGMTITTYTVDEDDLLPWNSSDGQGYQQHPFVKFILENRLPNDGQQKYPKAWGDKVQWRSSILECPSGLAYYSDTYEYSHGSFRGTGTGLVLSNAGVSGRYDGVMAGNNWGFICHYALNSYAGSYAATAYPTNLAGGLAYKVGFARVNAISRTEQQVRISRINQAAETFMTWDGTSPDMPVTRVVYRHPGLSTNIVFYDGHVQLMRTSDISGGTGYYGYAAGQVHMRDVRAIIR